MKKRILLYGFYGIANAGNEAMLKALIEPIRSHYANDIEFIVANRHPSEAYDRQYGVKSIPNLEYASRDMAQGRWLRGLNPDDSPVFMEMLKEVASSDLLIFGPGQFLVETGEFGLLKGSLAQFHVLLMMAKLTGVPFYGLALACEPLTSPWSILSINEALQGCDRLTFRDPQSVKNLEAAGIQLPDHEVLGDLALAAPAADPELARKTLSEMQIPEKSGPRLAVALRGIYWLKSGKQEEIRKTLAETIGSWLKKWPDADVLMIPQNVYNVDGDRDDDRAANKAVYELISDGYKNRVYQVLGEHPPEITEAFYADADVTLTSRLHGSVFSCKQGTPPVVLTFMDKTKGFFTRLGFPDRMVDVNINSSELFEKIVESYNNKEALSAGIIGAVDQIRSKAARYPGIAVELLEKNTDHLKREWAQRLFKKA